VPERNKTLPRRDRRSIGIYVSDTYSNCFPGDDCIFKLATNTNGVARCPFCKQEFSVDTMLTEPDSSKLYNVFVYLNPDCNVVLGIVRK